MRASWPPGFVRAKDEDWTLAPIDSLAKKYDNVERHGWYDNLDPTVDELARLLRDGDFLVDYSGGTGILVGRLLEKMGTRPFGVVNADSSPKFLRFCLDKYGSDPRVAFRLLRFLKETNRLQYLDEVLPELAGRVDAIVSANAIHLYYDLHGTLIAWRRTLKPSGRVLIQSGNIIHPAPRGMIIDDTVNAIHEEAKHIVATEERYHAYRTSLLDGALMSAHDAVRTKFFLPPRPLSYYEDELAKAGFQVESVRTKRIVAQTDEWLDFLQVYHEGVLGWVGGTTRIDGKEPTPKAVNDRLTLMEDALKRVLQDRAEFDASWTYITASPQVF